MGSLLGLSEEAARKCVTRSLEKLRRFFDRRGFSVSSVVLVAGLARHGADAAPAELEAKIVSSALALAQTGTGTVPTLVRETVRAWQWAKARKVLLFGTASPIVLWLATHNLVPAPPSPALEAAPAGVEISGLPPQDPTAPLSPPRQRPRSHCR